MLISRLRMVFTSSELDRISVKERSNGSIYITADVHGMKCCEAKRFINNIINIARTPFTLTIIHGYNHGTAIKEMLMKTFNNHRIFSQFPDPRNQGVTHMLITA